MLPALHEKPGAAQSSESRSPYEVGNFGDTPAEFAALRAGCGIYDLGSRAKIVLTGSDRTRWLNGMVTNNIRDLEVNRGVYAFLLNPQGRILGDLYAYNRGESILVDTDRSQLEKILATFDHYIIMDDVEVADRSHELTVVGLAGPTSRDVLKAAGIQIPELQLLQASAIQCACESGGLEGTAVRGPYDHQQSYEIWLAPAHLKPLWDTLRKAGATPVGADAIELQRIALGIPRYGQDIRERDLPQETEQTHAINFTKGCYIGQEIVERIRSRGNVHRKFTGFVLEQEPALIAPGTTSDGTDGTKAARTNTKITSGGKEVGEVTSLASLPTTHGNKTVALGYIRREVSAAGKAVEIGGAHAVVASLPFTDI
jgi:folate-binding protein YgfZ